ncbi:MAG: hypothetical protein NZM07_07700 [Elioraea sp.]|nr:hypothetical protein [Elioraea sp.]
MAFHPIAAAKLRAVWPDNRYPAACLLGRFGHAPLQGLAKMKAALDWRMRRIAEAMGRAPPSPWRLRDPRRTAGSAIARLGVPGDPAEAALDHVSGRPALALVYDRQDYQPETLEALRAWRGSLPTLSAKAGRWCRSATAGRGLPRGRARAAADAPASYRRRRAELFVSDLDEAAINPVIAATGLTFALEDEAATSWRARLVALSPAALAAVAGMKAGGRRRNDTRALAELIEAAQAVA